jgi:hypothetical protein
MKKGCFITSVVLFTIIVGIVVYIVKYKKDFLKEYSKNKIMNIAVNEFDKNMTKVKASIYKDSLQTEIHNFFKRNEQTPFDSAIKSVEDVINETRHIARDGKIDSLDFNNFKKFISRYERSEKNRN